MDMHSIKYMATLGNIVFTIHVSARRMNICKFAHWDVTEWSRALVICRSLFRTFLGFWTNANFLRPEAILGLFYRKGKKGPT